MNISKLGNQEKDKNETAKLDINARKKNLKTQNVY
jgi:hypothetical protein